MRRRVRDVLAAVLIGFHAGACGPSDPAAADGALRVTDEEGGALVGVVAVADDVHRTRLSVSDDAGVLRLPDTADAGAGIVLHAYGFAPARPEAGAVSVRLRRTRPLCTLTVRPHGDTAPCATCRIEVEVGPVSRAFPFEGGVCAFPVHGSEDDHVLSFRCERHAAFPPERIVQYREGDPDPIDELHVALTTRRPVAVRFDGTDRASEAVVAVLARGRGEADASRFREALVLERASPRFRPGTEEREVVFDGLPGVDYEVVAGFGRASPMVRRDARWGTESSGRVEVPRPPDAEPAEVRGVPTGTLVLPGMWAPSDVVSLLGFTKGGFAARRLCSADARASIVGPKARCWGGDVAGPDGVARVVLGAGDGLTSVSIDGDLVHGSRGDDGRFEATASSGRARVAGSRADAAAEAWVLDARCGADPGAREALLFGGLPAKRQDDGSWLTGDLPRGRYSVVFVDAGGAFLGAVAVEVDGETTTTRWGD